MTDNAQKAARRALQRWEGEGGAIVEGPQQARGKKRHRDTNQLAKRIVDTATGNDDDRKPRHNST